MVFRDTRVKSRVALIALRFERLLNHNAKLLPKEGQEDAGKLCCASVYPTSSSAKSMLKSGMPFLGVCRNQAEIAPGTIRSIFRCRRDGNVAVPQ